VEGIDDPVTSCDTPVNDKMVVTTAGDEIARLRKQNIQFILLNHPLECPVCDKAGECDLQDITYRLEVQEQSYDLDPVKWENDTASPLIFRSDGRCIRCGRCVAICDQVQDKMALIFSGKGYDASIRPSDGELLDCEFCGQCISVCPVGALIAKPFLHKSRVWDLDMSKSVCTFCGAGCDITVDHREDKLYRVLSNRETSHNKGDLCSRGRFGFHYTKDNQRIFTPLMKSGGELKETNMDLAISFAASKFSKIAKEHGPEAVAAVGSSRMTNEDAFNFAGLMKNIIGTENLDTEAGFGYRQILDRTFGRARGKFNDLEQCDGILIFGSDFAVEMPVPSLRVIAAVKERDSKLQVYAPYVTKLHKNARFPFIYRAGSERALAFAMIKIAAEKNLVDKAISDSEKFKTTIKNIPGNIDELTKACGVEKGALEEAVQALFDAKNLGVVVGPYGYNDCTLRGPASLLINILSPKVFFPSAERANVEGVIDMGCAPGKEGKTYRQIISAIKTGDIKALWAAGSDPVALFGKDALDKLDFLVVQESFMTQTAKMAHVVLPVASWSEKGGAYTSAESRVQLLEKAVNSKNDLLSDAQIFAATAKAMGGDLDLSLSDIRKEISKAVKGYPETIWNEGGFVESKETNASLFELSDKARLGGVKPDGEFDFMAIPGSSLYLNGTLSSKSEPILTVCPEAYVAANPADIASFKGAAGQKAKVTSKTGTVELILKGDQNMPQGVLFICCNFPRADVGGLFPKPYGAAAVKVEPID